jgi:cation transport ATPase
MNYFDYFKEGLKLIPSCLWRFTKKLFVIGFCYGLILSIPILIAVGVAFLIKAITQNAEASVWTFKILVTIGQIIPLAMSLYISEWELIDTNEDSAELCFAICTTVIAYIWIAL